jgi:hypothetical protein
MFKPLAGVLAAVPFKYSHFPDHSVLHLPRFPE